MSTPPTSFLLDAIRDFYINTTDPSIFGVGGLRRKETQLAKFTHEYLSDKISNYEEIEAQIAETLGDNLSKLLLGSITIDEILNPSTSSSSG